MRLALASNVSTDRHDTGPRHPERSARLHAAVHGLESAGLTDACVTVETRPATVDELARVHDRAHLERVERFCAAGGGHLDADTPVVAPSWATACVAAGAGLATIDALDAGLAEAGLVLCRPPGHHATRATAMGFCLVNSIAVAAAALVDRGQRVLIVDWDVHHGNGTQDIFWNDPNVLFASTHQAPPHYPGSGAVHETGGPDAPGATINVPLPAGATGDVVLDAVDRLIGPAAASFRPDWVLVSAGFDAHRADPLAGLALSAADFADLSNQVAALAPRAGRTVLFLEGGYDLDALGLSVGAAAGALIGARYRPEPSTCGGPGRSVVTAALAAHRRAVDGA